MGSVWVLLRVRARLGMRLTAVGDIVERRQRKLVQWPFSLVARCRGIKIVLQVAEAAGVVSTIPSFWSWINHDN